VPNWNPTWGYTRIQGALENLGYRAGRSTIARIIKAQGLAPPTPKRATSWQTFPQALGRDRGADFYTTEVWSLRDLVTFYTVFVIDLASRRVAHLRAPLRIPGSVHATDRPDLTMANAESRGVLICDRDAKSSAAVRDRLNGLVSGWCRLRISCRQRMLTQSVL